MKSRRILLPGVCLLLGAAILSACALSALMTDGDTVTNSLTVGNVETEIREDFPDPDPLPGVPMTKEVRIENCGKKNDCYVRVKAVFSDSVMEALCEVDWNTRDFAYDESDGFWYYREILQVGEVTEPLMTAVTIKDGTDTAMLSPFQILVCQEACQSENPETGEDYPDYASAWAAFDAITREGSEGE